MSSTNQHFPVEKHTKDDSGTSIIAKGTSHAQWWGKKQDTEEDKGNNMIHAM